MAWREGICLLGMVWIFFPGEKARLVEEDEKTLSSLMILVVFFIE